MDFTELSEYYRKNPPKKVLDDSGVRHIVEIPLPANYQLSTCKCGIKHPIKSDTWYHQGMKIAADEIAVYRACKECREILTKDLEEK